MKSEEIEEGESDWGFRVRCKGEEYESGRNGFENKREGLVGGWKNADRGSTRRLSLAVEKEKGERKVQESGSRHWNGGERSGEGENKGVKSGGFLKIGKVLGTTALTRNKA